MSAAHIQSVNGRAAAVKPAAVRDWASLMLAFLLVAVVLLAVVAGIMGSRRRRRRRERARGAAPSLELDAWTEAGRRAKPLPRVTPLDDRGIDDRPSDDEPPASRIREPEP